VHGPAEERVKGRSILDGAAAFSGLLLPFQSFDEGVPPPLIVEHTRERASEGNRLSSNLAPELHINRVLSGGNGLKQKLSGVHVTESRIVGAELDRCRKP